MSATNGVRDLPACFRALVMILDAATNPAGTQGHHGTAMDFRALVIILAIHFLTPSAHLLRLPAAAVAGAVDFQVAAAVAVAGVDFDLY